MEGISYKDIKDITGISEATICRSSRHIKLTKEQKYNINIKSNIKRCQYCLWSNEEIEFLKINYPVYGCRFCANKLNRSPNSISGQASLLGLKYNSRQQKIIKKLDGNKVLCKCKIHGITSHYNKPSGGSLRCIRCGKIWANKFNKTDRGRGHILRRKNDPRLNFISKIRSRLRECYCGEYIRFKDLGYTGEELRDHLHKIKEQQNNCCPICFLSYDEVKLSIDHIIPLANAKSKEEIIDLFKLSNLWPMCRNCNSSKNDSNYEEWCKRKGVSLINKG